MRSANPKQSHQLQPGIIHPPAVCNLHEIILWNNLTLNHPPCLQFQGVHTMLPISWPVSVVLAVILCLVHIGYRLWDGVHDLPAYFFPQLLAELIFLASASVSGLYYRIMSDAAHIDAVDGTRTGIEQRVRLECEREQQEQLLLSVIPAYIAAEVKRSEYRL